MGTGVAREVELKCPYYDFHGYWKKVGANTIKTFTTTFTDSQSTTDSKSFTRGISTTASVGYSSPSQIGVGVSATISLQWATTAAISIATISTIQDVNRIPCKDGTIYRWYISAKKLG